MWESMPGGGRGEDEPIADWVRGRGEGARRRSRRFRKKTVETFETSFSMAVAMVAMAAAWVAPPAGVGRRCVVAVETAVSMRDPLPPLTIRRAVWPDDYEAVCSVRAPTTYVVEDGAVGFMGKRVELSPEEALKRRVSARLGTALRDNASVLIAVLEDGSVVATTDLIPLEGASRRAFDPELPQRCLVRNVWVLPEVRRRGLARAMMVEAEKEAKALGAKMLTLDVNWDNEAALQLYTGLGAPSMPCGVPVSLSPDAFSILSHEHLC